MLDRVHETNYIKAPEIEIFHIWIGSYFFFVFLFPYSVAGIHNESKKNKCCIEKCSSNFFWKKTFALHVDCLRGRLNSL